MKNTIAIITARGGSKRIPHKNIRPFCGKPIIAYSIEAAKSAHIFDEIMVSTDDAEIADISKAYGASIPFMRSEKTSDDHSTTSDVISEVLDQYQNSGVSFSSACCIYPTAPFISGERLRECYDVFTSKNADSLIPVVRYSFPPQRAFISVDGFLKYNEPKYEKTRSQDLSPMFHDAGQFYFFRVDSFCKSHSLISNKSVPFEIPETEVQDIDNETDWKLAELKYRLLNKRTY